MKGWWGYTFVLDVLGVGFQTCVCCYWVWVQEGFTLYLFMYIGMND